MKTLDMARSQDQSRKRNQHGDKMREDGGEGRGGGEETFKNGRGQ